MNVGAKHSTRHTKTGVLSGKTSAYKKAIVQVAEGDTIDLYENF
jgi:large subunit ribosomal protein L23